MIRSLELTNFRAFESAQLPLSKLNVIVGANSAGKSSLICALQVLKQTLEDPAYGIQEPSLRLTGSNVDAGTYRDVVHNHNVKKKIAFKFDFNGEADEFGPPIVDLQLTRALGGFDSRWYARHYYYRRHSLHASQVDSATLSYSSGGQFGPSLSLLEFAHDQRHIWFTRTRAKERVRHWRSYGEGLPGGRFDLTFSHRSPLLPEINQRKGKIADRSTVIALNRMERNAIRCLQEIGAFLGDLYFIGPFRTPPKRRYTFSGLAASEAGQSGEQTVDLLLMEALQPGKRPLNDAVQFWMQHLKLASSFMVEPIAPGSSLFELQLERAGTARQANIADVGFGISQVLPVIVQGLLVPRGGTYVVQQPELHLHPDAQAGLADFLLFLSRQGVRVIVETHSEYLLVRLRRRLAEGSLPKAVLDQEKALHVVRFGKRRRPVKISSKDVSVVCITQEGRKSVARKIEINESFQFKNLPPDFMAQALVDRLAIAAALKDQA